MKYLFISLAFLSLLLSSCGNNNDTGVYVGTGVGGGSGGFGTGIGTGVEFEPGAGGAPIDARDREILAENAPRTLNKIDSGQQLSLNDIKQMSKYGLSDDTIINQIWYTRSEYHLSSDEILSLQKAGVSQKVINYMIQTGS